MQSLYPGKLSAFVQLNTFRRSQSDFSTFWKASIKGVLEGASLGEENRRNTVFTKFITQTIWFERFVREVELRVGSKSISDQELSIELMELLLEKMGEAVKGKVPTLERRDLTKKGAYFMSRFVE